MIKNGLYLDWCDDIVIIENGKAWIWLWSGFVEIPSRHLSRKDLLRIDK